MRRPSRGAGSNWATTGWSSGFSRQVAVVLSSRGRLKAELQQFQPTGGDPRSPAPPLDATHLGEELPPERASGRQAVVSGQWAGRRGEAGAQQGAGAGSLGTLSIEAPNPERRAPSPERAVSTRSADLRRAWAVGGKQWPVVSGQWPVVSGQPDSSFINHQSSIIIHQSHSGRISSLSGSRPDPRFPCLRGIPGR